MAKYHALANAVTHRAEVVEFQSKELKKKLYLEGLFVLVDLKPAEKVKII